MVWSRDHPLTVVVMVSLVSVFFAYHARHIHLDASTRAMTIEDPASQGVYDRTLDVFGSDNITIVYIKDPQLFTPGVLSAIEEVFYALQDIPGVLRVDGLFNATNFKGDNGTLVTSPLLDWVPQDPSELLQVRADALRNPLLNQTQITPDGTGIAITVTVDPHPQAADFDIQIANQIDQVIAPLKQKVEQVFQVGTPMIRRLLSQTIQADQWRVGPLFFAVLFLALIIGIRTFNGAFLPMVTGGLSILWTLGFMSMFGIPINMLTWIVPYLVFILGSTEDMHILSEYKIGIEHHQNRQQAIAYMAEKTGLAILLTGLTTFLGFLSIVLNEITLLRQFSLAAAFALFVNPLITLTVAPVYLRFFGQQRGAATPADSTVDSVSSGLVPRLANGLIYLVTRHRWIILGLLLLVTPLMVLGIFSLKVDNDLVGYFTKNSDLRVRSQQLHDELSGMQNFFIVLQATDDGAFKAPQHMQTIFEIQQRIQNIGLFDSSLSLADHVALINREMTDGDNKSYRIPDQRELIAQFLLLFSRDDLERYVSADFRQTNIHVRHNLSSSYDLKQALRVLREHLDPLIGKDLSYQITGEGILFNQAADTLATGQVWSLSLILVLIFVVMSILFVRLKAGLLALVPNIIPILCLFGIMGLTGVPLNPGTAMIAACAIGIAVDDTVHLYVRYHHEMRRLNDQMQAVMATIRGDLRPVLTTSVALAMGFSILILSDLIPTIQYGLLSAVVMLLAFISDVLITPILLSTSKLITVWDLLGLNLTENVIARSDLFRQMTRMQIKKVILLGHILSVDANAFIIRQGERGRTMYLILEGSVKVEYIAPEGRRVALEQFVEGDIFGEIALVNEVERTANVIATQPTRLLTIDWESLERVRKIYPRLSARLFLNLSRILGTRLAIIDTRL